MKIYNIKDTAWQPYKKYFVLVAGRGWTDGEYRTDSPAGWVHKWALDRELFGAENRGVTHFADMPND